MSQSLPGKDELPQLHIAGAWQIALYAAYNLAINADERTKERMERYLAHKCLELLMDVYNIDTSDDAMREAGATVMTRDEYLAHRENNPKPATPLPTKAERPVLSLRQAQEAALVAANNLAIIGQEEHQEVLHHHFSRECFALLMSTYPIDLSPESLEGAGSLFISEEELSKLIEDTIRREREEG